MSNKPEMAETVFEEAQRIIYGDREQTYGSPDKNLQAIADLWSMYLGTKYGFPHDLSAEDVCWMMVLLKMARQMNAHKRDNIVDAIGYAGLVERISK